MQTIRTDGEPSFDDGDRRDTLTEVSQVVAAAIDPTTLYNRIYHQIGRVMDTSLFFIALVSRDRSTIEVPYLREDGELISVGAVPFGNSVTSLVIERGTALLFQTDADYQLFAEANNLPQIELGDTSKTTSASQIFVPLNTGSRTIGAVSVQSRRDRAYTQDDVQTLWVIASQAAMAIANARLLWQSQTALEQMSALVEVAHSVLGSLNLETVLEAILSSIKRVTDCYYATIMLPDYSSRSLQVVGSIGPDDETALQLGPSSTHVSFGGGITGRVFETAEPVVVDDGRTFEGFIDHGFKEVRSEIAIPLKRGGSVVGVLDVGGRGVGAFSRSDLSVLSLFASQAAIAIENANLYTAEQRRVSELQAIQNIVQKLTPLHDVPAIAALINEELKQLINYHTCRIFIVQPPGDVLVPIAASDSVESRLTVRMGEGITGWIATSGQCAIIDDTLRDERVFHIEGTPTRVESLIGVPLVYEDRVRGVITLSRLGRRQFDENALRLLEIVAGQAALAFDRARLYAELRTEAITDPLTGLFNRRYLMDRYVEERSRAVRNAHDLVTMMLDIDKFKRVNDTFGHDAGDFVLKELAHVIRDVVRAEDIVSRYGGEEFCILLPEIPVLDAQLVAERLRATIERHAMPAAAGAAHVTVSIGMALLAPDDSETEQFTRADGAMYLVKRQGGNGVRILTNTFPDLDGRSPDVAGWTPAT